MFFGGNKIKIAKKTIIILMIFVFCLSFPSNFVYGKLITLSDGEVIDANTLSRDQIIQLVTSCASDESLQKGKDITVAKYDEDKGGCMVKYPSNYRALQSYLISGENELVDVEGSGEDDESWFGGKIKEGLNYIIGEIGILIQSIVGAFLGLSGKILDIIVRVTIFGMRDFVVDNEAIENSWEIIRDLINILFIFGLLFISIQTIIRGIGPKTRSLLVNIITAALLINFSFFFTTILIDVSNYLTIEIHKQLGSCADNGSISLCFSDHLSLDSATDLEKNGYADAALSESKKKAPDTFALITSILTSSIFMIILAFIFLALAIMLAIRFIVLIFLLITSPVMFLGWVLPNFAGVSKGWFDKLTNNLMFPPLAFLFLLITLAIASHLGKAINEGGAGSLEIILNFILITGFSTGSLIIAKSLGASGASFATAKAGNIMFGGAAKLGRTSIGRAAAWQADRMKGTSRASIATKNALKNIGKSSFDARNTKAFSGVASATGLTGAGLGTGTAQNTGFTQLKDQKLSALRDTRADVGKQTGQERKQEAKLLAGMNTKDANGNPTHEVGINMKRREDEKKNLERNRQELNDLDKQMKMLDKRSTKYKELATKAKNTANEIAKNKDEITKAEEVIKNNEDIKTLNTLRSAGKERQKDYVRRQGGAWSWSLTRHEFAKQIDDEAQGANFRTEDFNKLIK